jgi:HEAT repeat protein
MTKLNLQTVINALKDEKKKTFGMYAELFSDLDPAELEAVTKAWSLIPLKNKRALLHDLNEIYDSNPLLAFEKLAESLIHDADSEVRAQAIRLLKDSENEHIIPKLIKLLASDPDENVRVEAAGALGMFVYYGELEELNDMGLLADIEEALLAATNDSSQTAQRRAVEALGFSSRPEAKTLIEDAFKHHDPKWIATALFAMGRSAHELWTEPILASLNHENDLVRLNAVRAAGELGLASARPLLLAALEDEEADDVMSEMIWSLAKIGGEDVRETIENLLAQTDDDEMIEFLESALDELSFTEDMENFDLFALDPDDDLLDDDEEK